MRNSSLLIALGVIVLLVLIIGLYYRSTYNGLVVRSQGADAQWAQVETQYQRRFDLIPNLVEAVKGIFQQEQTIFGQLAEARTKYGQATTPDSKASSATGVETALGRLLVVMENYPQLNSSANVRQLIDELAGTENRISVERTRYNASLLIYNNMVKRFPSSIIAGMSGYETRAFFQAAAGAATPPRVNFGTPLPAK